MDLQEWLRAALYPWLCLHCASYRYQFRFQRHEIQNLLELNNAIIIASEIFSDGRELQLLNVLPFAACLDAIPFRLSG